MNIRLRYGLVLLIIVLVGVFFAPSHVIPSNLKRCPVRLESHLNDTLYTIQRPQPDNRYAPGSILTATLPRKKNFSSAQSFGVGAEVLKEQKPRGVPAISFDCQQQLLQKGGEENV